MFSFLAQHRWAEARMENLECDVEPSGATQMSILLIGLCMLTFVLGVFQNLQYGKSNKLRRKFLGMFLCFDASVSSMRRSQCRRIMTSSFDSLVLKISDSAL